jgi:hypothetical protein
MSNMVHFQLPMCRVSGGENPNPRRGEPKFYIKILARKRYVRRLNISVMMRVNGLLEDDNVRQTPSNGENSSDAATADASGVEPGSPSSERPEQRWQVRVTVRVD